MNTEISVYRKEIKYMISPGIAPLIKAELGKVMKADEYGKGGSYRIRSLYFDSFDDEDYYAKLAGIENRKKIRARIYDGSSDICKLELKQKFGNNQLKESLVINRDDVTALSERKYETLIPYCEDKNSAGKMYRIMTEKLYRPVAIIDYDRTAFKYPLGDVRVTIDNNIRSGVTNLDIFDNTMVLSPVSNDKTVLEVKYNGIIPGFISSVLAKYDLTEISYSKYALGRAIYM